MPRPLITLTTDFGLVDGYVAAMKGVILGICPDAVVVDVSHSIRPQAVLQGAYVLSCTVPFFMPGATHVAIVDPGVGGPRNAVLVQAERANFIAPDNGILSLALDLDPAIRAFLLTNPDYWLPSVSHTFHGRDIFAPVAAHMAAGADPGLMGHPLPPDRLVRLPAASPTLQPDGTLLGQVIHIDHFGNLVTNFRSADLPTRFVVQIGDVRIERRSRTYSDAVIGAYLAYIGSSGYLEIAVRDGCAEENLGVSLGTPVHLESRGEPQA